MNPIIQPYESFDQACHDVLKALQKQYGFDLWMLTRTFEDNWIVLQAEDQFYQVEEGQVFKWDDSFCSRMVRGEGPNIAPNSDLVLTYAEAPIAKQVDIKAYVGLPIYRKDGQLFGTLCAIDSQVQPEKIHEAQPTIELMAKLLSTLINKEFELLESKRDCKRALNLAETDKLTNIMNRRGWETAAKDAIRENKLFGTPVHVFVLDLDNLKEINDQLGHSRGDNLIKQTAELLEQFVSDKDVLARLGGDEFGIITFNHSQQSVESWNHKLKSFFENTGINISVGYAKHKPQNSFELTFNQADKAMYRKKNQKS
ncbi:sensor domain-containing diguanylate cyclase [Thiomicrorhabdus indica]|uniref:sensor domain-containing diguanylate cyclase n=1 Tax=Thiomicrorhabdus indica TaxID=2267253 RepID=UPI002AA6227A|nr:sensor domain-containing diguanylate cyclase [Thiomicrorhabdus indica]